MRYFIYSRKSVFTGKGESIENQIEMCRRYISGKFPADDADIFVYEDEGFSAKDTKRPQFTKMLRDIEREKPDFIVCYRLDRISRSVSDFSALIEYLNARGISFVCVSEEFDTSRPMGKAMMYVASVFAQLERETTAERVRDNMLMLARTGRWLGGSSPTGYVSKRYKLPLPDGRMRTCFALAELPEELMIIEEIYGLFLELRSVSGVCKRLIGRGVRSRAGKYYSPAGIKQILQNPVYCTADADALDYFTAVGAEVCFDEADFTGERGLISYNKRDYRKKSAPRQSKDKWIVAAGKHRGLIPGRSWAAVQAALDEKAHEDQAPKREHNDYSLLSGLIRCESCGGRMFAKKRTGKMSSPLRFDYICTEKLRGGTRLCSCPNIGGEAADDAVYGELIKYAGSGDSIIPRLKKLRRELLRAAPELPVTKPDIDTDDANDTIDTIDTDALLSLESCSHLLSISEKRALIRLFTEKLVWDGELLHIYIGK